ncbi:hypothetical protein BGZ79_000325 [Entomortierella chlamydospora]|nr:hypothetical protein BGZ79_000325 [Entomortierella chlamydospora]
MEYISDTLSEGVKFPVQMCICVSRGKDMAPKDLNGFSDPYARISIGGQSFTTKVIPKTLNPVWDAAFNVSLEPQSMPNEINFVFWDKDWLTKDDFMGAVTIPFDEFSIWDNATPMHYDDPDNKAKWYKLTSLPGKSSKISGEVEIKIGFIDYALAPVKENSRESCKHVWSILANGRNKLGLGQTRVFSTEGKTYSISDIPLAAGEANPTLGLRDSQLDPVSSSPPASSSGLSGVVFMDIVSASNLPKLHNVTRTGFDMDPFVIVSFGKSIYRTRYIRHKLDPVWNAKLVFKVHHDEVKYRIKYSVHDWDKMSGNDHIGVATMEVSDLIQAAAKDSSSVDLTHPEIDVEGNNVDPDMKENVLKINLESYIKPEEDAFLKIRAKFVSCTTLRKRFWRDLARTCGPDNYNGLYSKLLVQTMLESLGSTLSSNTIDGFFEEYDKNPESDELTLDELFEVLESRLLGDKPKLFGRLSPRVNYNQEDQEERYDEERPFRKNTSRDPSPQAMDIDEPTEEDFAPQPSEGEHLVRISTCPICHDSSLGHKRETDVVTHLAVCSGTNGYNLDKLILGDFVTEANAQRKWITKAVKSLGYGRYVVGRSNANIIVQDRVTGEMLEERMPTFIRLGIRLLYKSPANKIRVTKILADMSKKQGIKFDDPKSKRDIEPFIRFHKLESQMMEVLEPIENFKSFNEFFYRKLKPNARVLSSPTNDNVAVSPADCRMICFQTISDATKFWIKGKQFTVARLLGDELLAKKYEGGSLAIFRLAPQDYHRFHIPVKGILSEPKQIDGEYYTVNPMAIRSGLDVYGENKRVVSTIESQEFGTVAFVAIGAMMVGSIILTTKGGQAVERMDEHGYFAFGGSTIVLLFEPSSIKFEHDLVRSSKEQIEMLVKVGMSVGVSTRVQ